MKNGILSLERLWLSLRKDGIENKKSLLQETLIYALCLAGIMLVTGIGGVISSSTQAKIFELGLALAGLVIANRSFTVTSNKVQGMFYLMTPESTLERLLVALIKLFVILPIAYCIVFFAVDFILLGIASSIGVIRMELINFDTINFIDDLRVLMLFQSIYMLGSVWFEKRNFLKTTGSIILYFIVITMLVVLVIVPFFYDMKDTYSGQAYMYSNNFKIDMFQEDSKIWTNLIQWLLIPFFWTVAYFRISEKQI